MNSLECRAAAKASRLCLIPATACLMLIAGRVAIAATATPTTQPATEPSLRLLTYNIQFARRGLPRIMTLVRQQQPDIVCLQEIHRLDNDQDQATRIAAGAGLEYVASPAAIGLPRKRWCDVAVLSRWPIVKATTVALADDDDVYAIIATIDAPGGTLHVASVHAKSSGPVSTGYIIETSKLRLAQLQRLIAAVGAYRGDLLIVGDINAMPLMPGYLMLASQFTPLSTNPDPATLLTFPADKPRIQIDHVFGRGSFTTHTCRAIDSRLSDHRPLVLELSRTPADTPASQPTH